VTAAGRADFLAGVRVLELGDGVAGAAAAGLLWAFGADVVAVVDPVSPHRRGRPGIETHGRYASVLSRVLDRGKELISVENADALGDRFDVDVVIIDRVGGLRGPLGAFHDIDAYASFVTCNNRHAWLTISAFGISAGRANDVATELTIAAASGMLATVRDPRTGQPLKLAGHQSLLNTGQVAALAACHGLDLAAAGAPVHLDLAAVEATIATGPVLEVGAETLETGSLGGAKRYGSPADFYACADGLIRISAMEDHQWHGVVTAMGSPAWTEKFATVQSRIDGAAEIDEQVATWTRARSKVEAETVLQRNGVPATAMYSPAEILRSPQLAHRGSLEPLVIDDQHEAAVVGLPFRVTETGPASESARRSLRGLRMLEASRVLAVPLCGSILGALGVHVTKLEDLPRLDMYRRRGPYIDGESGMERSAYFALVNHSKASAAFDVDARRDALAGLVDASDVVIENLGAKRAAAIGLDAASVLARHPDRLVVSSSGFGLDGPFAEYRAYAYNLQASCALGYLTASADGQPAEIDLAWADLISGFALATIIAAWTVGPKRNKGAAVDYAMADLVISHFNEYLAAACLGGDVEQATDHANDLAPYAPHGVYRTADGWVALAVDGDERFASLVKVLALAVPADVERARLGHRRTLDDLVAAAAAERRAADLATELTAAGVPAEPVAFAADLLRDPQLVARDFFTAVEHPDWGRRRLVGIPWRVAGGPAIELGAPPHLVPLED
jgi:crotonobetainyl-CoA:carnitine CoA-transferase CaiB-like acyl-CoA transferase